MRSESSKKLGELIFFDKELFNCSTIEFTHLRLRSVCGRFGQLSKIMGDANKRMAKLWFCTTEVYICNVLLLNQWHFMFKEAD